MDNFLAIHVGILADLKQVLQTIRDACPVSPIWILFIIVVLVPMLQRYYFQPRKAKKRTEDFRPVAQSLGLPFVPISDNTLLSRLSHFDLYSQADGNRQSRNVFEADTENVKMTFFDYSYMTESNSGESGTKRTTHNQSVLHFRSPSLRLPKFFARPEGWFHKIGSVFGYQDIDFQTHPKFSKKYLLRGEDESQIRELFNDNVLTFFETQTKICVEADGDQFVIYRKNKCIKPDELKRFMDEGLQFFALFGGTTSV